MKLGVNLYSVRKFLQSEAEVRETFRKIRAIGYDVVQLSGAAPMEAKTVCDIAKEYALPVVCTHSPFDRILHDTDALIREHKTYGCPVIGLGSLPTAMRTKEADLRAMLEAMRKPVAKIRAAGLSFAYHNHAFEFAPLAGLEATLIRPAYLHMKDAIGAEQAMVPVGMGDGCYDIPYC